MIEYIEGEIIATDAPGGVTVKANGVGYHVNVTPALYAELCEYGAQDKAELWLDHRIHADAGMETLYGFDDRDQRRLFRRLLKLPTVGPGKALAVVAGITGAELREAIRKGDEKRLRKIDGVGPTLARRILTELKP